ncbi:MAG: AN1-type zinc finger protein [Promethearchaeota archaeon]
MSHCDYCNEEIGYLPFKCKYCGGTFCQKHRLPENHECSFNLREESIQKPKINVSKSEDELKHEQISTSEEDYQIPKELKKYIKRQQKIPKKRKKLTRFKNSPLKGTITILILSIIISIFGFILSNSYLKKYIFFSVNGLIRDYTFQTILTSLFLNPTSDLLGLMFFMFLLFFLYFISLRIELRYGTRFLLKIFFISGFSSELLFILLRIALSILYPLESYVFYTGFIWGAFYGMFTYLILPNKNQDITALIFFLPIRMKGKNLLLILILLRLLPGFLMLFYYPYYVLFYLPDLAGVLSSYLLFKSRRF